MVDPISIVTSALAIIKASGLVEWAWKKWGGVPGVEVSSKIVEIAGTVIGDDAAKDAAFVTAVQESEVRALILEHESELMKLHLQDKSNARSMYKDKSSQADKVAHSIMVFNLPAIIALLLLNGAAVYYIENPAVAVAIGNAIGASISFLWQERQQIVGFFFGSSLGSKAKGEFIKKNSP